MHTHDTHAEEIKRFKTTLKKHSMRATPQRLAVHEAMMTLGHASADMVTEEIIRKGETNVTVASVYNILEDMSEIKLYRRRMSCNNKMYFEITTARHIHLYDCVNHVYRDYADENLMKLIEEHLGRRRVRGYTIEDIDIQFIARPTKKTVAKQ